MTLNTVSTFRDCASAALGRSDIASVPMDEKGASGQREEQRFGEELPNEARSSAAG
ncbi:MAG: hypothetical protein WEE89_14410 [Gemmatimonadota bacterium]